MSTSTFIDQKDLVNLLDNHDKHTFVSIEAETTPRLRKTNFAETIGCQVSDVKKVSQFVAMIGLTYVNVIKNRLQKEGKTLDEYEAGETWHCAVEGTKNLRMHKKTGELYVWIFCVANNIPTSAYYNMSTGLMIDKNDIRPFLSESTPKNQGLEPGNEVIPRTYKLESIRKITLDKETYTVK
jgi:hypothetical protein